MIHATSLDTCIAYLVLARQEHGSHPLLVVRLALDDESNWTPASSAEVVEVAQIHRALNWSSLKRFVFCAPVHPLFDILRQRAGIALDYMGPASLRLGSVDVPVKAKLTVDGHIVNIALDAHYVVASALMGIRETFTREELVSTPEEGPAWNAIVAFNGASQRVDRGAYSGSVNVVPQTLTVNHAAGEIIGTTEVYLGASFSAWTHVVWYREQPPNLLALALNSGPIRNAVVFTCFGRQAILRQPITYAEIDKSYLVVTYLGEPLDAISAGVLTTTLGYLTGGRTSNVATETFSLDAKLRTIVHDKGLATQRKQPPIPITSPHHYSVFVVGSLSDLIKNFARWQEVDSSSFSAIFHHYAEGVDSSYPVTRTLRLSIAFEAFVNLVTLDTAENEKITTDEVFVLFRDALIERATDFQNENASAMDLDTLHRFRLKLVNLNSGSNTKRINRFWEIVNITVSKKDRELLRKLRGESVHNGFLSSESSKQDFLGSWDDAARLCDILNRAILLFAGYTGPILSAIDGAWLDPKTGEIYRVPPVPSGAKIEIQHNATIPPMSPEEKAAVELLSPMQHADED